MLKQRIVGVLVVKGAVVVQSIAFRRYLPVGSPAIAVEYLNRWGIDEIVLLDIDATPERRGPKPEDIANYARQCQVPLTVGGGIRSVDDIKKVIHAGADKVAINTAAVQNPALITEGAKLFGSQCIVVSIDASRGPDGKYKVLINSGTVPTIYTPEEFAWKSEQYGAGEIFLNSINKDGSGKGFDLELIQRVMESVNIPVIVCGGVHHPDHFKEALKLGVSAVAAANFFHYTEHSVITVKRHLKSDAADIRLDSYASYDGFGFDGDGRLKKLSDSTLEKLRFEYIPEEII